MDAEERELIRQWVERWRIYGPILEQIKTDELRAMTEEQARAKAERVIEATPLASEKRTWSGLIEQQRLFAKARQC